MPKFRFLDIPAVRPKTPELKPETPELKPETPELKPETPELKPETSELKPAPRQSQSFGDLRAQAVKDIRIPRASGLVVKTAAKQECTAEGPGFESRLVHFYCSWGLLGCFLCLPGPICGAFWGQKGAPEAPWAKGRRGAPGQNTQKPSWKQQNTVIYSVLLLRKQQNKIIYNVFWLQKLSFFEPRKA